MRYSYFYRYYYYYYYYYCCYYYSALYSLLLYFPLLPPSPNRSTKSFIEKPSNWVCARVRACVHADILRHKNTPHRPELETMALDAC
jgi:hypothetical protein